VERSAEMKNIEDMAPTRRSLLIRLKNWQDDESWKDFFDCYWRLIYSAALKAGLSDVEAQDVVQETIFSVAKGIPSFRYDNPNRSFKGWLLQLTKWRINDVVRRRIPGQEPATRDAATSTRTATVERAPDPAGHALEAIWDEEWENNLMGTAMERVKNRVDAKQYQLFELYVVKQWRPKEVARTLKVNPALVYMARHRVGRLVKREIARLRAENL
jgi:RNA polymerase sigma factor (sigma-70 family)